MDELIKYYNKFNEEKRLNSRHGRVEYITSMKYIHEYLETMERPKILDIGAGTGRYSVALAEEGYDVTAVEYVKYNLGILDNSFDLTLLFGPMYHLYTFEDKLKALNEAKRVTKSGGILLVAYCMNEYAVIIHGFRDKNIKESIKKQKLTEDFHCVSEAEDLYDYVRIEDINQLNETAEVKRLKIISADGAANYIRQTLNQLDEEEFELFIKYHLSVCERRELMGAGAHTVDILRI